MEQSIIAIQLERGEGEQWARKLAEHGFHLMRSTFATRQIITAFPNDFSPQPISPSNPRPRANMPIMIIVPTTPSPVQELGDVASLAQLRQELQICLLDYRAEYEVTEREGTLTLDDIVIDLDRRIVMLNETTLNLTKKLFDLLVFFGRNRGIVLRRQLILERVWGYYDEGNSRTVDVHIRWLREQIEADPARPRRLLTVRGVGYRLQ